MPEKGDRELTFAQAIREALAEEMRRDKTVCIMGEDVAEAGTPFKVLSGYWRNSAKSACSTRRFPKPASPDLPWARP